VSPHIAPGSSLDADTLASGYGARVLWCDLGGGYNPMACHCYSLGDPVTALRWLLLAMEGDQRKQTQEYITVSALQISCLYNKLSRHGAAIDILENLSESMAAPGGLYRGMGVQQLLLLRAVCLHNLAVQQLIVDQGPRAVQSCEAAMELMQAFSKLDPKLNQLGAFVQLSAAQMEVTWLAARLHVAQPRVSRALRRASSPVRDTRRSLLALAPLSPPGTTPALPSRSRSPNLQPTGWVSKAGELSGRSRQRQRRRQGWSS